VSATLSPPAEPLLAEVLDKTRRRCGEAHPETANALNRARQSLPLG